MAALPTPDEIRVLPRWAQVAFAARCARRVQSLFAASSDASPKQIDALDKAISLAETSAEHPATASARAARVAARAAARAADAGGGAAANASARASRAAASAAARTDATHDTHNAANAAYAAYATANAAIAIRRDFEMLTTAFKREGWTNETPVAPSFFGPMWPDEEPEAKRAPSPNSGAELPTLEELGDLSRAALKAFAARCAIRVTPLFVIEWPDAPERYVAALQGAVDVLSDEHPERRDPLDLSAAVRDTAVAASDARDAGADAASEAANSVVHALDAQRNKPIDDLVSLAAASAHRAADAAGHSVGDAACKATIAAMRFDLDLMAREPMRQAQPIWPMGTPEGWPIRSELSRDETAPRELHLEIEVPQDADNDEVAEKVSNLIVALSKRHRALGGAGLRIGGIDVNSPAVMPEGC